MMLDFPFILLYLTIASGLICLVDRLYFARKRPPAVEGETPKLPLLIDYAKSLFPVFLIVLLLRSFVAQLFVVPSGSLEPTIQPVEYILVSQFSYGLRLPVWETRILKVGEPARGDIVVFHSPVNPRVDFIKRVIGIPGDNISYIEGVFYINGKPAKQTFVRKLMYGDPGMPKWQVKEMLEDLEGVKHKIYLCADGAARDCPSHSQNNFYNLRIPKGEYLMIGDNRDDSDDSRFWGLVPEKYLVGKAEFIVLSWNSEGSWIPFHKIRWHRIGTRL